MKERASLLGGKFSILGTEGSGTTVHVSIPHSGR
jgi:signal transduction histidine kinase